MRSQKVESRRLLEEYGNVPDGSKVSLDKACKKCWQDLARFGHIELRQNWLMKAKWDPSGWALMNWNQLPPSLKHDLAWTLHELMESTQDIIEGLKS